MDDGCVTFGVFFICAVLITSLIVSAVEESRRNDPVEIAQHTPVTLKQMGVSDASISKQVGGTVAFHINTTNHSDRQLKITMCGPKHAYFDRESGTEVTSNELCTAYAVKAHSTKRLTTTKDDVRYHGYRVKILGKGGIALIETCRINCLWAVESHPVLPRTERPYEG